MSDGSRSDRPVRRDGGATEEGLFPLKSKWFRTIFYGAFLGWILYLLGTSMDWQWDNRLFPVIAGSLGIVLIVLQLANIHFPAFFERLAPEDSPGGGSRLSKDVEGVTAEMDDEAENGRSRRTRERYELYMVAWILALPILMYFFGMALTIPLYVIAFTWFFLRDMKTAILVSLVLSVFLYFLFIVLLEVQLWEGTLGLFDPLDYVPTPYLPI